MAFKMAGAIAIKAAIESSDPVILEPILEVEVDVSDDQVGDVVGDLNGRRGQLLGMDQVSNGKSRIRAMVPMANMTRYALDLRSITKGRGRFRQHFAHYAEIPYLEQQALVAAHEKLRQEHESQH